MKKLWKVITSCYIPEDRLWSTVLVDKNGFTVQKYFTQKPKRGQFFSERIQKKQP